MSGDELYLPHAAPQDYEGEKYWNICCWEQIDNIKKKKKIPDQNKLDPSTAESVHQPDEFNAKPIADLVQVVQQPLQWSEGHHSHPSLEQHTESKTAPWVLYTGHPLLLMDGLNAEVKVYWTLYE